MPLHRRATQPHRPPHAKPPTQSEEVAKDIFVRIDKVLGSAEVGTLIKALGCGIGEEDFDIDNLSQSTIKKYKIPVGKAQIEAVKIIDDSSFWLTSEDEGAGLPRLFKFKI